MINKFRKLKYFYIRSVSFFREGRLATKLRTNILSRARFYILVITMALLIAIFSLSEISHSLELAIYDFNFSLRPTEQNDERIVIVEWDEQSIQVLEETVISDDTLLNLLDTIRQQQPKIVGLDLYRDIPVLSPRLTDAQNIQAYNSLGQLFGTMDNLIGIEKTIEPIINPPAILAKQEQTAASDLPTDSDGIVRRAYMFPQLDKSGSPAGLPYLGIALGYQYLEAEGWSAEKLEDRSLAIKKGQEQIALKPLNTFNSDRYGLDILVNWRKGNPSFRRVSVTEVISNQIPPDLFNDPRLVLIGNVSASTADRHNLPLNKKSDSWTYGVQIPAQVASSIVSAAIDRRPLMNAVPKLVEFAGIVISILLTVSIVNKYQNLSNLNLYLVTFIYALCLTVILILFNAIAFTLGWWLPVAIAIGAVWITCLLFNYHLCRERDRKNVLELEMFVRDLQHSLGNILNSIASSVNRIQVSTSEVQLGLGENVLAADQLTIVRKRADNIQKQVARMERYRRRTEEFIDFSYLRRIKVREPIDINCFISETIARFEKENEYDYKVQIQQIYDIELDRLKVDKAAMEIVLENLLDNAFYSVNPKNNEEAEYSPLIIVKTARHKKTVEFSVQDNGIGIPARVQQKIFQPFVSFNYGQGIGLYLTKKNRKFASRQY